MSVVVRVKRVRHAGRGPATPAKESREPPGGRRAEVRHCLLISRERRSEGSRVQLRATASDCLPPEPRALTHTHTQAHYHGRPHAAPPSPLRAPTRSHARTHTTPRTPLSDGKRFRISRGSFPSSRPNPVAPRRQHPLAAQVRRLAAVRSDQATGGGRKGYELPPSARRCPGKQCPDD